MGACLEIKNLRKAYGNTPVIEHVNLELAMRDRMLLSGPSGSGKSTLLRLVAGLESADEGEIRVDGMLASRGRRILIAPHRRQLAMVFQDLGLWPNLTAWGNVMLGLSAANLSRAAKRERAEQALQLCNLMPMARKRPADLSGGEQQRVALARALAVQPRLLLLDEPCHGLELALRHAFLRQVVELSEEMGTGVILVTHDLNDARVIRGSIAVLEDGGVQVYRNVSQVRTTNQRTLVRWIDEFGSDGLLGEEQLLSGERAGSGQSGARAAEEKVRRAWFRGVSTD